MGNKGGVRTEMFGTPTPSSKHVPFRFIGSLSQDLIYSGGLRDMVCGDIEPR